MAHLLKIELEYSEPRITRTVMVPENFTFHQLHIVIQNLMNWENYHMYQFNLGKPFQSDEIVDQTLSSEDDFFFFEKKHQTFDSNVTLIGDLFNQSKKKINYTYDFGDTWIHTIKPLKKPQSEVLLPICTAGENAAPVEDCGGIGGFYEMLNVLGQKKNSEEKQEYIEWLGLPPKTSYEDIYGFNLETINEKLKLAFL